MSVKYLVSGGEGALGKIIVSLLLERGEKVNINDPSKIVTITRTPFVELPEKSKATYVVTALDRMSNESKPARAKIKH